MNARREFDPTSLDEIARRLLALRKALGHTQATMSTLIGATTHSAWNHYESGKRRIDVDHALRLCSVIGVSLDWIYRGNVLALPAELLEKIRIVERKLPQSIKDRPRWVR